MGILEPIGIKKYFYPHIIKALITIFLLGLAVNGLYDILKPEMVIDAQTGKVIWFNIIKFAAIFLGFCGWIIYHVYKANRFTNRHASVKAVEDTKKKYRGLILIISKPLNITPQDINKIIDDNYLKNPNDLDELYKIRSIGQLFKGIYKHRDNLAYIWPIVTEDSKPFSECIKNFIEKYCPNARLEDTRESGKNYCLLPKCNEGTEMINNVKKAVSAIYSEENLDPYGLKKRDVIMDMSGGTKPMTIGAVFGAIDKEIDFQYVEQTSNQLIGVSITPENILDKLAEYLMGLLKDTKTAQNPSNTDNE